MARRRKLPNGTGSIERVLKSPQGKTRLKQYRARLPAKYDSMGKKIQKDIGFFKTYNEALDALLNYKEPAPAITFKELYIKYKNTSAFKKLGKSAKNRYNNGFSKYYTIHDTDINKIVYTDLQEVMDYLEEEGYYKTVNGELKQLDYTKDSLKKVKTVAVKVYETAIKNNILTDNIAKHIEVGGVGVKRKKEIFTDKEIEKLYKSIPTNPNAMHILNMIFTGMRTGEYMGLKTKSIDLTKGTINDFGIKTDAGKSRMMYIHPKIKDIIKYLVKESNNGYILEYENKPVTYDKLFYDKIYYPALDKAEIKRRVPTSCRYTFATIAYYSGVNEIALQKLMGHTRFDVTANNYIQNLDKYIFEEFQKIK